ncbi:endonuclease III, partial [Mesorhizobium sp. M00.F.Ca.ET.158.01.1.1]
MARPKSKDSSLPKSELLPGRRDGANAKPRLRPARSRSIYSPTEVREIFRRFSVQRPEPKGELEHVNAFTLLVAVVLSAQATDAGVNKA